MMTSTMRPSPALEAVRALRRNDGTVTAPIEPPDGLVLPKAVFPLFWVACLSNTGNGPVNGLPARRGDVRSQVDAEGPGGLSAHGSRSRPDRAATSWPA
jgi:hypothetical protein